MRPALILSIVFLLPSCVGRPWIRQEIDCSWDKVQTEQGAIQVANSYLEKKGKFDFYKDSVHVEVVRSDFWVFFLKKEYKFPAERAVLVTIDGCASFIPLK